MVKNILRKLGKGSSFLGAIFLSAIVGGATTAVVMAAIPNNKSVINSCYDNTSGTLRVIDAPSATCAGTETSLKWDQDGVKAYAHVTYDGNTDTYILDPARDKNIANFSHFNDGSHEIFCFDTKLTVKSTNLTVANGGGQVDASASVDPAEFATVTSGTCPTGTDALTSLDPGTNFYVSFY